MTKARFTEKFKEEAVRQVIEQDYTVPDLVSLLGVSAQSFYKWIKACALDEKELYEAEIQEARRENLKLKAELQLVSSYEQVLSNNSRCLMANQESWTRDRVTKRL